MKSNIPCSSEARTGIGGNTALLFKNRLMDAMNTGAVLVVDEIEASMHPLLTRHLIEMIQDSLFILRLSAADHVYTAKKVSDWLAIHQPLRYNKAEVVREELCQPGKEDGPNAEKEASCWNRGF